MYTNYWLTWGRQQKGITAFHAFQPIFTTTSPLNFTHQSPNMALEKTKFLIHIQSYIKNRTTRRKKVCQNQEHRRWQGITSEEQLPSWASIFSLHEHLHSHLGQPNEASAALPTPQPHPPWVVSLVPHEEASFPPLNGHRDHPVPCAALPASASQPPPPLWGGPLHTLQGSCWPAWRSI